MDGLCIRSRLCFPRHVRQYGRFHVCGLRHGSANGRDVGPARDAATLMADLGDVGTTILLRVGARMLRCRAALNIAIQPNGNGPISNTAPFVATPNAIVNLNGARGAQMDRWSKVDANGLWYFVDLAPGTYFATEAGVSRQWQIDVAADLSFTVTPITSTFAGVVGYGYVG